MDLKQAEAMALELMTKHELITDFLDESWVFQFDNARRRFGQCRHRRKTITLSKHLTLLNSEAEVKNVILHEIAHALVGTRHGHDAVWRAKAIEIGCTGDRCYDSNTVNTPESKYKATCSCCGKVYERLRKHRKEVSCGVCSNKFDRRYLLNFVMNVDN